MSLRIRSRGRSGTPARNRSGARSRRRPDGVHSVLDDETLRALLLMSGTPESTARAIVSQALRAGSRDNASAVVIDVVAGEVADPSLVGDPVSRIGGGRRTGGGGTAASGGIDATVPMNRPPSLRDQPCTSGGGEMADTVDVRESRDADTVSLRGKPNPPRPSSAGDTLRVRPDDGETRPLPGRGRRNRPW